MTEQNIARTVQRGNGLECFVSCRLLLAHRYQISAHTHGYGTNFERE